MHGRFNGTVVGDDSGFFINGKTIASHSLMDPAEIPWAEAGTVGVLSFLCFVCILLRNRVDEPCAVWELYLCYISLFFYFHFASHFFCATFWM